MTTCERCGNMFDPNDNYACPCLVKKTEELKLDEHYIAGYKQAIADVKGLIEKTIDLLGSPK